MHVEMSIAACECAEYIEAIDLSGSHSDADSLLPQMGFLKDTSMRTRTLRAALIALCFGIAAGSTAQASGELRFGVEPSWKPFEYKLPDGTLTGFDIDIGEAICRDLALRCIWVENNFDSMILGLKVKKFDAILSGMAVTERRLKEIDFSQVLYKPPVRLVGRVNSGLLPSPESLSGRRVGVQQGSTEEMYANKYWRGKGADIVSYRSQAEIYSDLASGRLDVGLNAESDIQQSFLSTPQGAGFVFLGGDVASDAVYGGGVGIGIRKGDKALKDQIDRAITDIKKSGEFQKIAAKYFKSNAAGLRGLI